MQRPISFALVHASVTFHKQRSHKRVKKNRSRNFFPRSPTRFSELALSHFSTNQWKKSAALVNRKIPRAISVSGLGFTGFRERSMHTPYWVMSKFRERQFFTGLYVFASLVKGKIPRAPIGLPGPKSAELAEFSFRSRTRIPRATKFLLVCGANVWVWKCDPYL